MSSLFYKLQKLQRLVEHLAPLSSVAPHQKFSCVQRESFDVIGKVGFGRDFAASRDINNPVNTFQMLTDDLEEGVHRLINPWRKYSRSQVSPPSTPLTDLQQKPHHLNVLLSLTAIRLKSGCF